MHSLVLFGGTSLFVVPGVLVPMSVANSKKSNTLQHSGFEWAGAMARAKRAGTTSRTGRRSALLGLLTASYANSSRNTTTARSNETR